MVAPSLPEGEAGVAVGRVTHIRANRSVAPISLSPGVSGRMEETLLWGDVTHIHEPLMPRVGTAALRSPGPKLVTFHADPPHWVRWLYRRLGPWVGLPAGRDTMVTAVSRQAGGALPSQWGPEKIVPNGVEISSGPEEVERRRGRVVFLGRDEPRKGLSLLLNAWPKIRRRNPHAELIVMGSERPAPPDGVVYLGRVSGEVKERTLRSAEIYVAPNLGGESFGIVLLEAMNAGCALIASDLPAFEDVAGPAARFFKTGDPREMAKQVSAVLADRSLSARLATAGRERAGRFSWENVGATYRDSYQQVINRS